VCAGGTLARVGFRRVRESNVECQNRPTERQFVKTVTESLTKTVTESLTESLSRAALSRGRSGC
jgi:hypothetical protein